ncbi:Zinc finger protein [Fasciola hepatica]|uniref:Zinc finger protein n=1 Tax=Fasciola hepatica TaxID=6192 RepID=A0A2H1CSI2_FASHE|nr:Zinc finger protein [Fasciola hepatica]
MKMDSLLNDSSEREFSTSPLNSSSLLSSTTDREHSLDEEKLSRVLIERVLPPFSKSLKLKALVVYQADREKMNCLMVNRNYEKIDSRTSMDPEELEPRPGQSNSLDEVSDLSDSGYVDCTKLSNTPEIPLKPGISDLMALSGSSESADLNPTVSRRKRKLCRPCKIPQQGTLATEIQGSMVIEEVKVPRLVTTSTTTVTSTFASSNSIISTSTIKTSSTTGSSNEIVPFTTKTISDSVILPVTAVTILPRVSVFSLPVTVLSTLPRPILPRLNHEKPTITVTTIPATSMLPTSAALSQPISLIRTNDSTTSTGKNTGSNTTTIQTTATPDLSNRRFGKSFLCNQCRRDFSSLSLLCAHTFAVHRCFRCTICDAQFTQRSNLQRHSLRHVGFKPFICKVCDKAYYRKDHLVRHIELSHPGRDPRLSLTVKLSSAECLEYLERLQAEGNDVEQVQMLCQTPDEPKHAPQSPVNGIGPIEEAEPTIQTSPKQVTEGEAR